MQSDWILLLRAGESRNGYHIFMKIISSFLFLFLIFHSSQGWGNRTVSLLVKADEEFRQEKGWEGEIHRLVEQVSAEFQKWFGIKFSPVKVDFWHSNDQITQLQTLAIAMGRESASSRADLVVGVTAQNNFQDPFDGFATVLGQSAVIRYQRDRERVLVALKHELAHLFGALHIRESHPSIMNPQAASATFDPFNTRLVRIFTQRNFDPSSSPIEGVDIHRAVAAVREISPYCPDAGGFFLLGRLYYRQGSYELAVQQFNKAEKWLRTHGGAYEGITASQEAEVFLQRGLALAQLGQIDRALEDVLKANRIFPELEAPYFHLGLIYMEKGWMEEAILAFNQVVELNPDFKPVYEKLGEAMRERGRYRRAISAVNRGLNLDPESFSLQYLLGTIYERQGEWDRALKAYQTAAALDSQNAAPHIKIGVIKAENGDLAGSVRALEAAVRLEPDNSQAHLNLGVTLVKRQQGRKALIEFKKAIKLDPSSATAYRNAGMLYWNLYRDREEALQYLRKGMKLEQDRKKRTLIAKIIEDIK